MAGRLAFHAQTRGLMQQHDAGGGLVDVLAAGTGGTIGVFPDVRRSDLYLKILSFRKDGNGSRRCVDPSLGFCLGDPLDPVDLLRSPAPIRARLPNQAIGASGIRPPEVHHITTNPVDAGRRLTRGVREGYAILRIEPDPAGQNNHH